MTSLQTLLHPTSSTETSAATTETSASSESGQYDPKRGLGKYDESNVDVSKEFDNLLW